MIGFILEKIVACGKYLSDQGFAERALDVRQHSPVLLLFHERLIYCLTFLPTVLHSTINTTLTENVQKGHSAQSFFLYQYFMNKGGRCWVKLPKITG